MSIVHVLREYPVHATLIQQLKEALERSLDVLNSIAFNSQVLGEQFVFSYIK